VLLAIPAPSKKANAMDSSYTTTTAYSICLIYHSLSDNSQGPWLKLWSPNSVVLEGPVSVLARCRDALVARTQKDIGTELPYNCVHIVVCETNKMLTETSALQLPFSLHAENGCPRTVRSLNSQFEASAMAAGFLIALIGSAVYCFQFDDISCDCVFSPGCSCKYSR
jgi:hypothetical protein